MRIPIYQVDAFTGRLFGGNPAAVCPLPEWLPDATLQAIAAENNLAETAFFAPQGEGYLLRWFTPTVEVELWGEKLLVGDRVRSAVAEFVMVAVDVDGRPTPVATQHVASV